MPITPEQARKVRMETAAPAGVPDAVIGETIRLYEEAGWYVERSYDHRDGTALVFSERAP
jgi:hypothetical protein